MNAEEFAGALHPVVYRELSGQTHWRWSQQDLLCEQLMGPAGVRAAPPELLLHTAQLLPSPPQPQPVGIGSFQVRWPKSRGSYDLLFSHLILCPQQVLPALFEMDAEPFHIPYLHCYYLRLKHGLSSLFLLCLQVYSFFPSCTKRFVGFKFPNQGVNWAPSNESTEPSPQDHQEIHCNSGVEVIWLISLKDHSRPSLS